MNKKTGLACPNCASLNTVGAYDEQEEDCELWVCNACGWKWNRLLPPICAETDPGDHA